MGSYAGDKEMGRKGSLVLVGDVHEFLGFRGEGDRQAAPKEGLGVEAVAEAADDAVVDMPKSAQVSGFAAVLLPLVAHQEEAVGVALKLQLADIAFEEAVQRFELRRWWVILPCEGAKKEGAGAGQPERRGGNIPGRYPQGVR
jgi:hypothetical protein